MPFESESGAAPAGGTGTPLPHAAQRAPARGKIFKLRLPVSKFKFKYRDCRVTVARQSLGRRTRTRTRTRRSEPLTVSLGFQNPVNRELERQWLAAFNSVTVPRTASGRLELDDASAGIRVSVRCLGPRHLTRTTRGLGAGPACAGAGVRRAVPVPVTLNLTVTVNLKELSGCGSVNQWYASRDSRPAGPPAGSSQT